MSYTDSECARLYWTEQGSGPPILLIMGLSFTHEMWYRTLPALADYRAILFDNRGIGRSSVPPGPYSIRKMARDARAILDAAGIASAHVLGASMGGMIAQELALQHPKRVRSMVLACTSFSGLWGRWPDFSWVPACSPWTRRSREEREQSLVALLYAKTTPAERVAEDIRIRCSTVRTGKGFTNQFAGILAWNSYFRLPRIKVPTLIIHGDQDRLVPFQNGQTLARRIPGARFQLVRDAGHIMMTDQPEMCSDALLGFLREQRPGCDEREAQQRIPMGAEPAAGGRVIRPRE